MRYLKEKLPSDTLAWKRLVSLLYGLLVIFQMGMLNSQILPFFPVEASRNKNLPSTQIGLAMGVYDVATMTSRIVLPHRLRPHHYKPLFIAAFALHASSSILFGFMDLVQHSFVFFLGCFTLRLLLGACNGIGWTAFIALVMSWYPERKTLVVSSVETCVNLGLVCVILITIQSFNSIQENSCILTNTKN